MVGSVEFTVTIRRKEVVAAALPLQEHWLPLSNLDLLLPPLDVGVFFCYKKPTSKQQQTFATLVSDLKEAMAHALVTYYAYAGEVVTNSVGEPEVLCNNRGVDFVEAHADVELRDLRLYDPDESVEGKLVPKKKAGVLSVQVTEIKCGGIVVACSFDHRVSDAHSANMFLLSWVESAQAKPISISPTFRRSLLSPRRPGSYSASIDDLYVPISMLPPPKGLVETSINRIYYITADQIERIQALCSPGARKSSKLEAFSAYLWHMIATCAAPYAKTCSIGVVVDGRSRLQCNGFNKKGHAMATYFGNVLSIPYLTANSEELKEMELGEVADSVHDTLQGAATEEHFLGLVDWVEARRPEKAVAKVYCVIPEEGVAFVVSSGQRFPLSKVDFGWGKPVFGSYHFPWGGDAGYVMPMPSTKENGDWVVYMHLKRGLIQALEVAAGDVFRPLTSDYLGLW